MNHDNHAASGVGRVFGEPRAARRPAARGHCNDGATGSLRAGRALPVNRSHGRLLMGVLAAWAATSIADAADPASQPATASQPAATEADDIGLLGLEVSTVVTASRHEERIMDVPYAISIITSDDIRFSGARSVPDALRLAAGVDVADLTYGNAAVSPRGLQGFLSNQVLVLVDGRQIFDSLFGGTVWGSWPFQLEDIDRIEVIRGPGGVTWGANAVNGVINIITKDPRGQTGLTLTAGGGSRGTWKSHLGYATVQDKLRLRVSGEYEASDGFNAGGSPLRGLDDAYQAGRMGVHAIYDYSEKDRLTLSAGSGLVGDGFPPAPLGGIGMTRHAESQANYVLGKWEHTIEKDNTLALTGYVNDFQASPGLKQIDYRYQQLAFQLGHTFKPADAHTLTWGLDTRADLLDGTNSEPQLLSKSTVYTGIIGLYAQDEWRFAPRWALTLGGRADYEFYGGFEPSARASLSYETSRHSLLYAAVSRAFQMPPAGVRFVDFPLLNGLAWVTADQGMDASDLYAYEIGWRARPSEKVSLSITPFWHQYSDQRTLSPVPGPPGLLRVDDDNRADAKMYGVENEWRWAVARDLTLLGNYTYQQLDWRSARPLHEKDSIAPPQHKAMLGARYDATKDLHFAAHAYFVDDVKAPNPSNPFIPRHIDSYIRLDLRAEYDFWKERAQVAVGVRNLLEHNHWEGSTLFLNDAQTPRMIYAELRITFR